MNDCPMTPENIRVCAKYIRNMAGSGSITADELERLADWLANDRRRRRFALAKAALTGLVSIGEGFRWEEPWVYADQVLAAEPPMPEVER